MPGVLFIVFKPFAHCIKLFGFQATRMSIISIYIYSHQLLPGNYNSSREIQQN